MEAKFSDLKGKVFIAIAGCEADSGEVFITCADGDKYKLCHEQDCCEQVSILDVVGNVSDLIGSEILVAEESSNNEDPAPKTTWHNDSYTWTYYKLATIKGYVDIRWFGSSNGWYSEKVTFSNMGEL